MITNTAEALTQAAARSPWLQELKDKFAIAKHELLHISNNEAGKNSSRSIEAAEKR
jgi:hypothetical protein